MADFGGIKIKGLPELEKQLQNLDNAASGRELYRAVSAALAPMQKTAKSLAPRAESAYRRYMTSGQGTGKTALTKAGKKRRVATNRAKRGEGKYQIAQPGLLQKSIRRRRLTKGVSRHLKGVAGAVYIAMPDQASTFNSPFYWHFVEYGTRNMAASPFMRPAFDQNKDQSVQIFADKLKENIAKHIK